jgi:hypothetical protein
MWIVLNASLSKLLLGNCFRKWSNAARIVRAPSAFCWYIPPFDTVLAGGHYAPVHTSSSSEHLFQKMRVSCLARISSQRWDRRDLPARIRYTTADCTNCTDTPAVASLRLARMKLCPTLESGRDISPTLRNQMCCPNRLDHPWRLDTQCTYTLVVALNRPTRSRRPIDGFEPDI